MFPTWSGWNAFLSSFKAIFPILQKYIDGHKKSFDPQQNPKDFIDIYLQKISNTRETDSSFFGDHGGEISRLNCYIFHGKCKNWKH
jgi:hypothetical protein